MIYVVLGMHKSGTTLLARTLHASGIRMVEDDYEDRDYDRGGNYEWTAFQEINAELLDSHDQHSLMIHPHADLRISASLVQRARSLVNRCQSEYDDWGFKDPRTLLTYPFWRRILPEHRIIGIFRHPGEVQLHYASSFSRMLAWSFPSLHHWCVYNRRLLRLRLSASHVRLLLNFREFILRDQLMRELSALLNRDIPDLRKPDRYRNRLQRDSLYRFSRSLYELYTGTNPDRIYDRLQEIRSS
jgi:hypothetical protein